VERLSPVDAPAAGDGDEVLDRFLVALSEYLPAARAAIRERRVKDPVRLGRWFDALGDYLERLLSETGGGAGAPRGALRSVPPSP
jgi:hypothetical protein